MCGIVGAYSPQGLSESVRDNRAFARMLHALDHRGPDDKGILTHDTVWLGHARLTIIDLATGQQPMGWDEDGVYITFNGEIFNYIELREVLEKDGYSFHTTSDTEVLLRLYQARGEEMLNDLNGQFAFCIWDKRKNKVMLARDHAGILPLFYVEKEGTFFFASSITSLLQHPMISPRFDRKALKSLIHFWVPSGSRTFFEGIRQMAPGTYMIMDENGITHKKYWDISFPKSPSTKSKEEWVDAVRETLTQAVKIRLRADVPVGSYLSGGLDSSIIAALVHDIHKQPFETFSVQFLEDNYDETAYQQMMTEHCDVPNSAVRVTPEMIADAYEKIVRCAEQPIYRTAPAPLFYLSQLVRDKGLKVILTGEGADEIGWGYNIFKETVIRQKIASGAEDDVWQEELQQLYPYLQQFNERYARILMEFYRRNSEEPDHPLFSHLTRMNNGLGVLNYMLPEVKEEVLSDNTVEDMLNSLPENFSDYTALQKTQYVEMKTLLAGYLLSSQGDRMTMAHSIEARFPFLDKEVISLFAEMPDDLKLNGMDEKHILKEAFRDILPEDIVDRPKQPYRAPESLAILSEGLIERYLSQEAIEECGIFAYDSVEKLCYKLKHANEEQQFSFNDNFALNCILSTQIFYDSFMKGENIVLDFDGDMKVTKIAC